MDTRVVRHRVNTTSLQLVVGIIIYVHHRYKESLLYIDDVHIHTHTYTHKYIYIYIYIDVNPPMIMHCTYFAIVDSGVEHGDILIVNKLYKCNMLIVSR